MADMRMMPREVQEEALDKGLIPYIPHDRLLEELEAHLPMIFHPVDLLVPTLIEMWLLDGV